MANLYNAAKNTGPDGGRYRDVPLYMYIAVLMTTPFSLSAVTVRYACTCSHLPTCVTSVDVSSSYFQALSQTLFSSSCDLLTIPYFIFQVRTILSLKEQFENCLESIGSWQLHRTQQLSFQSSLFLQE